MKTKKSLVAISLFMSSLSAGSARAAGWVMPENPGNLVEDFMGAITTVSTWLLGLATSLAVLAIIYGGVIYAAAGGDTERIGNAKKTIKYAIMGLAMAGIAYAIVNVIITRVLVG